MLKREHRLRRTVYYDRYSSIDGDHFEHVTFSQYEHCTCTVSFGFVFAFDLIGSLFSLRPCPRIDIISG